MQTEHVKVDRWEAEKAYRAYKKNQNYQRPEDEEIMRTYRLIAQGKTVIRALDSIKRAGLNEQGLPKLAIGKATAEWILCHMHHAGGCEFSQKRWSHPRSKEPIVLPADTFPRPKALRGRYESARAMVPIIPPQHRPQRGLDSYHILWEAEWERIPPKDPYLLRRLGKGDSWLVLAAWDLTPVEQAAMATRVFNG